MPSAENSCETVASRPRSMAVVQKHIYLLLVSLAIVATYLTTKSWTPPLNPLSANNFTNVFKEISKSFTAVLPTINNRTAGNDDKIIHFLGLFELSDENGMRPESQSEVTAAKLAVKDVNSKNVLPGYFIKLLINDTKCDPGVGVDTFFHAIYSNKSIMMLLGSGCSNVSESLAHIVVYWNILQVSYGSTSPNLSDRNEFPLFFRTVPPDSSYNPARVAFIKYYNWKTIAAFCESGNSFLLPLNNLVTILENANITCSATVTFSQDNYREQLLFLKNLDTRIIVGSFSMELASKIFCAVYDLKMFGSDYVWLLQEPDALWWENSVHCDKKIVEKVVERFILISDYSIPPENITSISGLTHTSFREKLNTTSISKHAKYVYDAIWCMALTLRRIKDLFDEENILDQFDYNREDISDEFVYGMSTLDYMGVSGPIKFSGADRIGNVEIKQVQNGELRRIAIYSTSTNYLNFNCTNCTKVLWHGGQVPIAQRVFKTRLITIPKVAFYIIFTVSIVGVIICLLFLYLNLRYRRVKSFKMSSPKLNTVAVFGCIFVYIAVILLGIDKQIIKTEYFTKLCTLRVYLLSAGFSLTFGSMLAKTYRVHRIFTYGSSNIVKDKILKDKQLIGLILLLLLIDGIIISFWIYVDPLNRHLKNLTIEISPINRAVLYQTQVEVCGCNNTKGWFLAIYGYKGLLLITGVYMAWETRNVQIQALNESQYIGICVYSAISSAIVVSLSNFLSQDTTISYIATTSSILVSTTITLFLLFLPKLRDLFGRSTYEEDPVMQSMGLRFECNTRRLIQAEDRNELCLRMEIQNKVYRNEIANLDKEICRLENVLFKSHDPRSNIAIIDTTIGNLKTFKSENTLQESFTNRICIDSSWLDIIQNLKNIKPSSNPEINSFMYSKEDNIFRASSISIISKEFSKNVSSESK